MKVKARRFAQFWLFSLEFSFETSHKFQGVCSLHAASRIFNLGLLKVNVMKH